MARSLRAGKVTALVATLLLVATACSKSSNTPSSPVYNVFAQKFRFHGMPATIPSGNFEINFSNKESFPITHEMILKALPSGKTAQDIIDSAKVPGCKGGGECETDDPGREKPNNRPNHEMRSGSPPIATSFIRGSIRVSTRC